MEACHANDRHRADVGHVACALTEQATAQSRNEKFPYDATIADDEVYARSGPGNKPYYPTARLRKGDRVTVIRHDPGGWYMIEPPPGSFAWVRQEHVKRQEDRGIITGDSQVVAWVGTSFGDDHYVEQRRLQPGEEVAIIGEKTLKDERGEVSYLRIKSPKGHFRWIPGAKIVTSDKQLSAANARARGTDPFAGESKSAPVDMASHEPGEDSSVATDGKSVPAPKDPGRRPAPTPKDLENESPPARSTAPIASSSGDAPQRLAAVDQQLQEMLKRETRDWDFAAIETELQDLQANEATSAGAARRLASLGKYKQVKADSDEFARLMEETNRRDAELAATQRARLVPGTIPPARDRKRQPHRKTSGSRRSSIRTIRTAQLRRFRIVPLRRTAASAERASSSVRERISRACRSMSSCIRTANAWPSCTAKGSISTSTSASRWASKGNATSAKT